MRLVILSGTENMYLYDSQVGQFISQTISIGQFFFKCKNEIT